MNDPLPQILQGLNQARNVQCQRHDIDPVKHQRQLLEHVPENAMTLADALNERWLNPSIIIGSVRFLPGQARTVNDAYEQGCVHQWVEVDPGAVSETYFVDLAAQTRADASLGSPLVAKCLPDGYEKLPNGTVSFDDLPATQPVTETVYREYSGGGIFH